jgi:hypothetical protein
MLPPRITRPPACCRVASRQHPPITPSRPITTFVPHQKRKNKKARGNAPQAFYPRQTASSCEPASNTTPLSLSPERRRNQKHQFNKTLAVQATATGTVNNDNTQKPTTHTKFRVNVSGRLSGNRISVAIDPSIQLRKSCVPVMKTLLCTLTQNPDPLHLVSDQRILRTPCHNLSHSIESLITHLFTITYNRHAILSHRQQQSPIIDHKISTSPELLLKSPNAPAHKGKT